MSDSGTLSPTSRLLQQRLDELTRNHGVPGAAVAVTDGQHVSEAASGVANTSTGVPVTTDTLFQIGSATKPYTATLVLQLADEGRIDLDAPVTSYLPGLTLPSSESVDTPTVRQLLSHTSGLQANNFGDFGRGEDATARYVASLGEMSQLFTPGTVFSYSNSGYVLLGRLIEVLTGRPFHTALRELLLEPAGLTATATLPEEVILRRVAVGHTPSPDNDGDSVVATPWSLSFAMTPAGSMTCATARDLLSFAHIHTHEGTNVHGSRTLSPESVEEMRRRQVAIPDIHGLGAGYGLGWFHYDWNGTRLFGHDGATASQRSFLRIEPTSGVAAALVTNQREGGTELYAQLFDEIFNDTLGLRMPSMPEPAAAPHGITLSHYEGAYHQPEFSLDLRSNGSAMLDATLAPNEPTIAAIMPEVGGLHLEPVDESVFLLHGVPGTTGPTPVTFFDFDTAGRPSWLHFSAQAHRRQAAHQAR